MELKWLRYFVKAASTGSFQATAQYFNVQPSSVSRAIAALEKELGQQLFYRSTRAIKLTNEGMCFRVHASDALESLDEAVENLAQRKERIHGSVRINAPEALGRLHVAKIVNQLQDSYPDLNVDLTLTDVYIDPVREGVDITIRIGPLVDSGLIGRVVAPQQYILAASPGYIENNGFPRCPQDLGNHNCLLYKGINTSQKWHIQKDANHEFEPLNVNGSLTSNNAEILVAAALAGRGIVLMPTWMFKYSHFEKKELINVFPQLQVSATTHESFIQILSPENRVRSRKVREITNFFLEKIGSPPFWDLR